ncbi:MAG: DUF4169 family protein [Alphaproteobacteria bacterium]|jgi:hypothetical protein|nr:DUF4169 family protein [Alphaproteobacteria bacterium]
MTRPINLNRFRKAKRKTEKTEQAAANRVKFGRTKAEKAKDAAAKAKSADHVDASKLEE